jgi:hypothetical protein
VLAYKPIRTAIAAHVTFFSNGLGRMTDCFPVSKLLLRVHRQQQK